MSRLSEYLRTIAGNWTAENVRQLIASGEPPKRLVQQIARFMADKPMLWSVSDEEFLSAVEAVNPEAATVLRDTGYAFMGRMSRKIMERVLAVRMGAKDEGV